jgi:hypothetical protein
LWQDFKLVAKSYIATLSRTTVPKHVVNMGGPMRLHTRNDYGTLPHLANNLLDNINVALGGLDANGRADFHLSLFGDHFYGHAAFNEYPTSDAKDDEYRLFAQIKMKVKCICDEKTNEWKPHFKDDTWEKDGGKEGPGINGTANLRYKFIDAGNTKKLVWTIWGRPNRTAEPVMQAVRTRSSKTIWNEGTVEFTCDKSKISNKLVSFPGSNFPSRVAYINGAEKKRVKQGQLSDLWHEHPTREGWVR